MDNAGIHHYSKLKKYVIDSSIPAIYGVRYASRINPVELIFYHIKIRFYKIAFENKKVRKFIVILP
jgi:hypothetical protein